MTREEILSLSGHALSKAVAIHVMGWSRINLGNIWTPVFKYECNDQAGEQDAIKKAMTDPCYFIPTDPPTDPVPIGIEKETWEPNKDIRAAWDVFQNRRNKPLKERTAFFRELGELLHQIFGSPPVNGVWPDAPDIICRAALLSVMTP